MTVEQRLDQLDKCNKRLTVGLTMMAMTMAAMNIAEVGSSTRYKFHRETDTTKMKRVRSFFSSIFLHRHRRTNEMRRPI
jgi:hypothetical protein